MLTPESIKELRQSEELVKLLEALKLKNIDAIAVPEGFRIEHLEKYRENRERLTGTMKTTIVDSFQLYVDTFMPEGAKPLVFIEPARMAARCAMNFGTTDKPGHVDHWAELELESTSAYRALLKIAPPDGARRQNQREAAEWCEDYVQFCTFHGPDPQGEEILPATAIKALRNLKIEAKATSQSGVGNFSREKSLMESTQVDTSEGMPHFIKFRCTPYKDLTERVFLLRVGTGRDPHGETVFAMQIVRHDLQVQEMAEELADLVKQKLTSATVFLGTFKKGQ